MQKLKQYVDKILAWAIIFTMALLVLDVLWQVFSRFILRDPSSYTEELARYLMIWVGLLGASYAADKRMHLAVDLLPLKMKGRRKQHLNLIIEGFTILFALSIMVIGGARLVWVTLFLGQTSPALQIPLGYVYLVVPISGLLIIFYSVLAILEHLQALRELSVDQS